MIMEGLVWLCVWLFLMWDVPPLYWTIMGGCYRVGSVTDGVSWSPKMNMSLLTRLVRFRGVRVVPRPFLSLVNVARSTKTRPLPLVPTNDWGVCPGRVSGLLTLGEDAPLYRTSLVHPVRTQPVCPPDTFTRSTRWSWSPWLSRLQCTLSLRPGLLRIYFRWEWR